MDKQSLKRSKEEVTPDAETSPKRLSPTTSVEQQLTEFNFDDSKPTSETKPVLSVSEKTLEAYRKSIEQRTKQQDQQSSKPVFMTSDEFSNLVSKNLVKPGPIVFNPYPEKITVQTYYDGKMTEHEEVNTYIPAFELIALRSAIIKADLAYFQNLPIPPKFTANLAQNEIAEISASMIGFLGMACRHYHVAKLGQRCVCTFGMKCSNAKPDKDLIDRKIKIIDCLINLGFDLKAKLGYWGSYAAIASADESNIHGSYSVPEIVAYVESRSEI